MKKMFFTLRLKKRLFEELVTEFFFFWGGGGGGGGVAVKIFIFLGGCQ